MARALDLYPARVQTPSETFERVRVHAADGQARIWRDEGRGNIVLVASVAIGEGGIFFSQARRTPHRVSTVDGIWEVTKLGGCGCGDPLKRFRVPA